MTSISATPKFCLLAGEFQDVMDFSQYLHQEIGAAIPDIVFHLEPTRPTASHVYDYLREVDRDAQDQRTELFDRLLYCSDDSGENWQHLSDLEPAVERTYVEAVATLWLVSWTAWASNQSQAA